MDIWCKCKRKWEAVPKYKDTLTCILVLSLLILNIIKNVSNQVGYQELFYIQYEAHLVQLSFSKRKAVLLFIYLPYASALVSVTLLLMIEAGVLQSWYI